MHPPLVRRHTALRATQDCPRLVPPHSTLQPLGASRTAAIWGARALDGPPQAQPGQLVIHGARALDDLPQAPDLDEDRGAPNPIHPRSTTDCSHTHTHSPHPITTTPEHQPPPPTPSQRCISPRPPPCSPPRSSAWPPRPPPPPTVSRRPPSPRVRRCGMRLDRGGRSRQDPDR